MVICFECRKAIEEEKLIRVVWLQGGIPTLHISCLEKWQSRSEMHKTAYQGEWATKSYDDDFSRSINDPWIDKV